MYGPILGLDRYVHMYPRLDIKIDTQRSGWFPFLFYTTTWVGEIYLRYDASSKLESSKTDIVGDIGRIGSRSLVVFSFLGAAWTVLLPWLIHSPQDDSSGPLTAAPTWLSRYKPSLINAWTMSCVQFSAAMFFAPFVTSVRAATFLIALCSIPSALANWAPFTFMGIEINRLSSGAPFDEALKDSDPASIDTSSATGELAGRYLGMLNVYMTIPQFIGSGISMLVFSILEPGKSPDLAKDTPPEEHHKTGGLNGIAVCLCIGALSNLMAARAARRLSTIR